MKSDWPSVGRADSSSHSWLSLLEELTTHRPYPTASRQYIKSSYNEFHHTSFREIIEEEEEINYLRRMGRQWVTDLKKLRYRS